MLPAVNQLSNLDIFDFELSDAEMKKIDSLTKEDGRINKQDPNEHEEF